MNVGRVKKDGPVLKLDRRGEKVPKKWNVRLGAAMAGRCYSYRFASLKPGQRTAHLNPVVRINVGIVFFCKPQLCRNFKFL